MDVTLLSPDAPIIQLFKANDTHPPTRYALGFQITDVATAAEALDRNGFGWECLTAKTIGRPSRFVDVIHPGRTRLRAGDFDVERLGVRLKGVSRVKAGGGTGDPVGLSVFGCRGVSVCSAVKEPEHDAVDGPKRDG